MTFKKLVKLISTINDIGDSQSVFDEIKKSYETGKITFEDYETLYDIADFYGYGKNTYNLINHAR